MFSKLSILVLFLRYMPRKPTMVIFATMGLVVLYTFVAAFGWVFACRPVEKFWDLTITYGTCVPWSKINIFSGVMSIVAGAVVLGWPIGSIVVLALVVGAWLIVLGIVQIISALSIRKGFKTFDAQSREAFGRSSARVA